MDIDSLMTSIISEARLSQCHDNTPPEGADASARFSALWDEVTDLQRRTLQRIAVGAFAVAAEHGVALAPADRQLLERLAARPARR